MSEALTQLKAKFADLNALGSAIAIFDWDQQTYMPHGGASARAQHTSILQRMHHELLTSPEVRDLADRAIASNPTDEAYLRVVRREIKLKTKLPSELVEEKARLSAIAHEEWVLARRENNFAGFAPTLERMFAIAREEAEHYGYEHDIYDALLDSYEEGSTSADVRAMFDAIKAPQVVLVQEIAQQPAIDNSILIGDWSVDAQKNFTERILGQIGFDFNRGRQDVAPHPFCTGWSIGDIRLTTRYQNYLGSAIFGSLHEMGHGLYEQGSDPSLDLTPLQGGVSLGVHESQSRLWENIIGRSRAFWTWAFPIFSSYFPQLADLGIEGMYRAVNRVQPSLIRVEADELTYNLHILIRFEIESAILKGDLAVADLPAAWNAKYESYLGITPDSDSNGCLQDVHWSMGSIGYFPTYSMGNLLGYQIWNRLLTDLPTAEEEISQGHFSSVLGWLTDNIYRVGKMYTPRELVQRVTGKPMDPTDYLAGLDAKYRELYGLKNS